MLSSSQMPKLVYLTFRRHPRKLVTLTVSGVLTSQVLGLPILESLEAANGEVGWGLPSAQVGLSQPGIA